MGFNSAFKGLILTRDIMINVMPCRLHPWKRTPVPVE